MYEMLNKVDMLYWPKSKKSRDACQNFKNIISGLESFCQEKLDAIINSQTSQYEVESLVANKDLSQLIEIVELAMGVVVSCEDKEEYISRIIELDPRT